MINIFVRNLLYVLLMFSLAFVIIFWIPSESLVITLLTVLSGFGIIGYIWLILGEF